jgi:hypothetical protein
MKMKKERIVLYCSLSLVVPFYSLLDYACWTKYPLEISRMWAFMLARP